MDRSIHTLLADKGESRAVWLDATRDTLKLLGTAEAPQASTSRAGPLR